MVEGSVVCTLPQSGRWVVAWAQGHPSSPHLHQVCFGHAVGPTSGPGHPFSLLFPPPHLHLESGGHAQRPVEKVGQRDCVRQREPRHARSHRRPAPARRGTVEADGECRHACDDRVADGLQADREPTVGGGRGEADLGRERGGGGGWWNGEGQGRPKGGGETRRRRLGRTSVWRRAQGARHRVHGAGRGCCVVLCRTA